MDEQECKRQNTGILTEVKLFASMEVQLHHARVLPIQKGNLPVISNFYLDFDIITYPMKFQVFQILQ
jgi:hypothetical protein